LLAARGGSRIPLDIAAGLAGVLLLALPLRRFRISRAVAPVAWVCVFGLTIAAREGWLTNRGEGLAETAVLAIAVLGLLLAVALHRDDATVEPLHHGVALGLAVTVGAALMFIAFAIGSGSDSDAAREASLLVCILALGSVVAGTALTGFVLGFREVRMDDIKPRKQRRLKPPKRAHFNDPLPFVVRSFYARAAYVALVAMVRLMNGCAEMFYRAVAVVVRAANGIVHVGFQTEFMLRLAALWTFRLLGRAAIDAIEALKVAARSVSTVIARWATSTGLGLVLLAGAAQLAAVASALFESYLRGATLLDGVGAPVLMLAAGCVLVVIWWTLTKWPLSHILRSALHTVEGAGPSLFLTLVALGWIDGIAGMLGFGPIRPGWLTVGGTVVLFAGGAYVLAREWRQRSGRSTA
jgi:hypothetical protein